MYKYIATGAAYNKLKPVLVKHNITFKQTENKNIKEWACGQFECDITPKDMLPYMEEANLVQSIIPITANDLKNKRIKAMLIGNFAHLAYLSETDKLIIKN